MIICNFNQLSILFDILTGGFADYSRAVAHGLISLGHSVLFATATLTTGAVTTHVSLKLLSKIVYFIPSAW